MKDRLLGIDIGSYSTKAVLTDLAGQVLATEVVEHDMSFPEPGWAEHDADAVWWGDVVKVCRALFADGRHCADAVAGVGISAVGPCLLPLDAAGRPLRPAILYGIDTRAKREINELTALIGEQELLEFSGMTFTSQAIGPKMLWLKTNEPDIWAETRTFTTASSYVVFRLTGEHVIDRHTASHFMPFFDLQQLNWSDRYAKLITGSERLPRLAWTGEQAGTVSAEAAAATGLAVGTPVNAGTIDVMADAVSAGVTEPGSLMLTYGSSISFILVLAEAQPDPRVWMTAGAFPGTYALSAGMATSGSLTRWFRDELAGDADYAQLFAAAAGISPGSEGLLFLPYLSGERTPLHDPDARGVVAGLSLSHSRDHLFRAALEGVAYGIRHNLEVFSAIGAPARRIVSVGGGTTGHTWVQIVSDVTGYPQAVPTPNLGAPIGSAFLAGLAAGVLSGSDLQGWQSPAALVEPDPTNRPVHDRQYGLFRRLYEDSTAVVHKLAGGG